MLHAMGDARAKRASAEIALGFDGDGDRCGVVDDKGEEIFADKIGVLLARDLSARFTECEIRRRREVDRHLRDRSGAEDERRDDRLLEDRPFLHEAPHPELGALAGFEKSGHYFFNPPLGRGYDDGIVAGIAVLEMLDRARRQEDVRAGGGTAQDLGLADHGAVLPRRQEIRRRRCDGEGIRGPSKRAARKSSARTIAKLVTVNGVRVTLEDGTWGLVRASSNKPSLVVVVESPVSEANMRAMFADIDARLKKHPEVGEYDQKI